MEYVSIVKSSRKHQMMEEIALRILITKKVVMMAVINLIIKKMEVMEKRSQITKKMMVIQHKEVQVLTLNKMTTRMIQKVT